jgi:predicted AAA+ superfamily ATPase
MDSQLDNLITKSNKKAQAVSMDNRRYIYDIIDWEQRLIMMLGYRGTGKTTLLLQHLSTTTRKGVYFSMDDIYFESNRLVLVITFLYEQGYRAFYLDEVHKYAYWSKDLKQLYDDFDDIKIVATGSSILDISKGEADLSRRASRYSIEGMSFREYLQFEKKTKLPAFSLEEIIERHNAIAPDLCDLIPMKKAFENYLQFGYFPFYKDDKRNYAQKLEETMKLVIDTDIAPFEDLQYSTVRTMKKLLYVISQSVPFTPNIYQMAERLGTPRNTLLRLLDLLDQARIIRLLRSDTKGVNYLQKPEKIFLDNPNFAFLFSAEKPNIGNLRETFFLNQLSAFHDVTSAKYGDFLIDQKYTFEVGGPNKGWEQLKGVPLSYLALDMNGGSGRTIPLWLFGFTY